MIFLQDVTKASAEEITFGLFTVVGLIVYAVGIAGWLIRLETTVKSKEEKASVVEKASEARELTLKCFARIEALEKTVDGADGLKVDMKEIKSTMQRVETQLAILVAAQKQHEG